MKIATGLATRMGASLFALILTASASSLHAQQYGQQGQPQQGPPPGQGYGQNNGQGYGQGQGGPGWDAPPNEFSDVGRRGFHDGIEAARFDFGNHRPLAFQRNPQFRHPPVPGPLRGDYRGGFQRGYQRAADRMMHQGPPPPPPGNGYYPH